MCYFLCVSISDSIPDVQQLLPPALMALETSRSPIGEATIRERSDRRAFLVVHNGCSCDILTDMKQEFLEVVDRIVQLQTSTSIILHWFKGAVKDEEIGIRKKINCSLQEFRLQFLTVEEDVRYCVVHTAYDRLVTISGTTRYVDQKR